MKFWFLGLLFFVPWNSYGIHHVHRAIMVRFLGRLKNSLRPLRVSLEQFLGANFSRILRDNFSLWVTLILYSFLIILYYPSFLDCIKLLTFSVLHLYVLRLLNYNLSPLEKASHFDLGATYYLSAMTLYFSCAILLSFFSGWWLVLLPENYYSSWIMELNLRRLMLGSYALGVLLWISLSTIRNLAPVPPKPFGDLVPNPRFINKARYVGKRCSFWGKHTLLINNIGLFLIFLQGAGTFCRIFGYGGWWASSPFPWMRIFIALFLGPVFIQHSFKTFIFAWLMQKRYYEKYKAQDDALFEQQQNDLKKKNNQDDASDT